MTPEKIIAAARECLGTPFRHQGRLPGVGIDCAGLAVHVAGAVGCAVGDMTAYGRVPNQGQLEAAIAAQLFLEARPDGDAPRPGDLLLFRFGRDPMHIALLTDADTIIHAYEAVGKCCEHGLSVSWTRRIVRAYRFKGMR